MATIAPTHYLNEGSKFWHHPTRLLSSIPSRYILIKREGNMLDERENITQHATIIIEMANSMGKWLWLERSTEPWLLVCVRS